MCTLLFSYMFVPFDMGINEKEQKKISRNVRHMYRTIMDMNTMIKFCFLLFSYAELNKFSLTFFYIILFSNSIEANDCKVKENHTLLS